MKFKITISITSEIKSRNWNNYYKIFWTIYFVATSNFY